MRKISILLSLLVLASMLLSACGSAATPVPTEAAATDAATGEPAATAAPAAEDTAPNPYIGSGQLDGNGVPPDFFSDVHIRKAFSYAFNWDTFAADVYNGEAVQSLELPLLGMPGYNPDEAHYYYDLAKSEEEFKLADLDHDGIAAGQETDGSDIWNLGFRLQIIYTQGNTVRQTISEILAAQIYKVNPLFLVDVLGLPFPAFLSAQRAGRVPIIVPGWQEDIHDPHNWYKPFINGTFGSRQHLPADLAAELRAMVNDGVAQAKAEDRAKIYDELNQIYYEQAIGLPMVTATSHNFEQRWVLGRIQNPLYAGINFYTLAKTADAPNPSTFTEASIADITDLDPALSYDTASAEVVQAVYETLIFFDGIETNKFVPQLADSYEVSADGLTYTFHIRSNVKFNSGNILTPSDVAYSFQRGLLQGGYVSPQQLIAEPLLGIGNEDISQLVDETGALADDREGMMAADPAALKAACEKVMSAVVADEAAATVTMKLAQPWGPFLPTLAGPWGSVIEQKWAVDNGAWDGSCDTWQNYYAATTEDDPINTIMNGTGPFKLDHRTPSQEIVLVRNEDYWGKPATLERVVIQVIPEFGTRYAMLQAGDADWVVVNPDQRPQVDNMVGEMMVFDMAANKYGEPVQVCSIDPSKLGLAKFVPCAAGETGKGMLRLYIGRPAIAQDVITYNFNMP